MRGLAWDDRPQDYIAFVQKYFEKWGVDLVVVETEEEFLHRWETDGPWDFVITDLVKEADVPGGDDDSSAGIRISSAIHNVPVYLITQKLDLLKTPNLTLPGRVVIKSKSTHPAWMAKDIVDDLKRQGVFVDQNSVFIIYGHDAGKPGLTKEVESWLTRHRVTPQLIKPENLTDELLTGLLTRMQSAAAFIAICTPDDPIAPGRDQASISGKSPVQFQPRQNVLLEIGMVLGLPRGMQRLIILKTKGPAPDAQTTLPSDLAGLLSISIENSLADHAKELHDALHERGVRLA